MSARTALVGPPLQAFLTDHLCHHKRTSPQTIASCRDTFRLFLTCLRDNTGIAPSSLRIVDLEAPAVLEYLEQQRGNSVRTRNIRLSAIRSFFRLVAVREPDSVGIATRVLAIPVKREDKPLIGYLTRAEMDALLAAPDQAYWAGRRDHALLLTLYNSGARVSEIIQLKHDRVRFSATTFLELKGKGRTIPLWPHIARTLTAWFRELEGKVDTIAFPNARGRGLSRDGVDYLLKRAAQAATTTCPSLGTKKISPHLLRHYV